MKTNILRKNENYMLWSKLAVATLLTPSMLPANVRRQCALMLLGFGTLMSGCSGPVKLPSLPPGKIISPVLSQPLPSVSYLITVQQNIESWEQILRATSPTLKP